MIFKVGQTSWSRERQYERCHTFASLMCFHCLLTSSRKRRGKKKNQQPKRRMIRKEVIKLCVLDLMTQISSCDCFAIWYGSPLCYLQLHTDKRAHKAWPYTE